MLPFMVVFGTLWAFLISEDTWFIARKRLPFCHILPASLVSPSCIFSKPFFSYLFWICVFFLRTCWSSCPLHGLYGILMTNHVSKVSVLFIVAMYLFPSWLQGCRSCSCVKRAIASGRKLCDQLCGSHMLEVFVFLSWFCCKIPSSWIFRVTYCSFSVSLFFWWYK